MSKEPLQITVPDPESMEAWGASLAKSLLSLGLDECLITLSGPLGAGKTTFIRGFMRGMGYFGSVKSPTYTWVEPYVLETGKVHHFDLYRLNHPAELESIGFRDYIDRAYCLIEWPEKGQGYLPPVDIQLQIAPVGDLLVRQLSIIKNSHRGEDVVVKWMGSKNTKHNPQ